MIQRLMNDDRWMDRWMNGWMDLMTLPPQTRTLQSRLSLDGPVQLAPPWTGGGFVHERVRIELPLPHVLLQDDQLPQGDQFPFTVARERETKGVSNNQLDSISKQLHTL